jgi:hypothetical protein
MPFKLKLTTTMPITKIRFEEKRCRHEIALRKLWHAQACREKPQLHNQQDLALAHGLVPRLEGISEGTGRTEGKF